MRVTGVTLIRCILMRYLAARRDRKAIVDDGDASRLREKRGAKAVGRKENGGEGIGVDGEVVVSVKWGKLQNNETPG